MNSFIAYFDYLGFKEFIEKNDLATQKEVMGRIFRDMERALGRGKYKDAPQGVIADISNSKINCINFSDTVVFFTKDVSEESLTELLEVSYTFNYQAVDYFFPVKGSVVYGELEYVGFNQYNNGGGAYHINSIFGKGLVKAYSKANEQNWAGTVFDESFIGELKERGKDLEKYLHPFAKKYKVPYKNGIDLPEEFVLNIIKGTLNDVAMKSFSDGIQDNFAQYKKSVDKPDVQAKLKNTLMFLESYYVKEKEQV